MYARTAHRIRLRLPEHFARDRCCIPLAERQELQQVGNRVSLGPPEVGMRNLAGEVADEKQQRGDGIWNGGADATKYVVAADINS